MKQVILMIALTVPLGLTSCKDNPKQEKTGTISVEAPEDMATTNISFGVRGNCEMCKTTIEKAANSVSGVVHVNWNVDKKKIDVSFDDTKTDAMAIHKAIAESGYDTEKYSGSEDAYNQLPSCCKYDREMMMNH